MPHLPATAKPATQPLSRRIAHLDMDAFYASVELLRYPQLKGLPVVIGGGRRSADDAMLQAHGDQPLAKIPLAAFPRLAHYTGRGVITTATYAARQFGVGSAMGLMKAAKLCPQAILLPVDFAEIKRYSQAFKRIILDIAPLMEDRGVDEVYIDFTHVPGGQREGGRVLARLIQKTIFQHTGLTCSVGVAPNKLLAKMASEFNKPNGIAVVHEADLEPLIWPLACRKINGIGPKADEKLQGLGIATIGQLAQKDVQWLIDHFGQKTGVWLHDAAHGIDLSPVALASAPVSISRETTFERDLHPVRDKAELGVVFTQLCEQVAADLARQGYVGKTIGVKLRFDDFKVVTRDHTLALPVGDAATLRRVAGQCLKRVPLTQKLRLLGVRVGSLMPAAEAQKNIENRPLAQVYQAQAAIIFD
ncbi:DNA polymerase IV [Rhodoferax sp.]|uniref:DNA polymerase Y family protein n=1 Tax=Rhodoferax sp. TaxID=50421 RepID=UPI0026287F69|nr:DNA polymerase IV [Rhodoferax sp.]MDD5002481.1 DNA polymerase IV [Thiomonas arsenitoxydans]MDD5480869.1 DNA polymerase IV [Rhodoferax sp.]